MPWTVASDLTVNGRVIALPPDWAVLAMTASNGTTILDVSVMDESFAVQVGADRKLTRLAAVEPPFALSADGHHLAGLAPTRQVPVDSRQPVADLVLVDLRTRSTVRKLAVDRPTFPQSFVGQGLDGVLVRETDGPPLVWAPAARRLGALDLPRNNSRMPLAVDPSGTLFITADAAGRVSAERRGAAEPEWSSTVVADRRGAFSPDGSRVAFSSRDTETVLDVAGGSQQSRSSVLGGQGPWEVIWEDSQTILAGDPDVAEGNGVVRCAADSGDCARLSSGPGWESGVLVLRS